MKVMTSLVRREVVSAPGDSYFSVVTSRISMMWNRVTCQMISDTELQYNYLSANCEMLLIMAGLGDQ